MPNVISDLLRGAVGKRFWQQLLVSICFLFLLAPARGDDKSKDEETLKNAAKVLSDMVSSKNVSLDVLANAKCIVVLPSVKKFGFVVGGSGGRGPMSCRVGKNFTGRWSPPAMYTIGGASFGLQAGGSATDFVLLVMSQNGVEALLKGKTKLGNEATAAAGPSGATRAGTVGGKDILTYADASGLFAGTSLGAATLEPDNDANQKLYNKAVTATEIVRENAVKATPGGQEFVSMLNSKVVKRKSQ